MDVDYQVKNIKKSIQYLTHLFKAYFYFFRTSGCRLLNKSIVKKNLINSLFIFGPFYYFFLIHVDVDYQIKAL